MDHWNRMLIAVDGNETSMRAVRYVGAMVGSRPDVDLCLLNIAPEPHPYYYLEGHSLADYTAEKQAKAEEIFSQARALLAESGVVPQRIRTRLYVTEPGETISQAILTVQKDENIGTVVVGKRGVSKAEEFLFGSISNAVVQHCDFAVWVVG